MDAPKLFAAKSVAERLDCSVSMFYKEVKEGNFPAPDVKLWKESKRGFRWFESTVTTFIITQQSLRRYHEDQDAEAPPFVKIDVEKILQMKPGKRVA